MSSTEKNILILCTGNSARSILGEAIVNQLGAGRLRGFSAGSKPKGEPHPTALAYLKSLGHDTSFARAKSWTEFTGPKAPKMDFIFTVCSAAAGETCPAWPGHPASAHWGIPDPAGDFPTQEAQRNAFATAYAQLTDRITLFLGIPFDTISPLDLQARLDAIGRIDEDARVARRTGKAS